MSSPLLLGVLCGLLGSVPVAGPISALVLARTLTHQAAEARRIALGAATAEVPYAAGACVGMGALLQSHPEASAAANGLGSLVLFVVGAWLIRTRELPAAPHPEPSASASRRGFALGFGITALNPTLIATWSTVTAWSIGRGWLEPTVRGALPFGIGVGLGAALWFLLFVALIERFRERLPPSRVMWVQRGLGVLLLVLSGWGLWGAVTSSLSGDPP